MQFIDDTREILESDASVLKKTGIGSLVLLASIFILPYFVYHGYLVQILKQTDGEMPDGLPVWTDWGTLFKDGLIWVGIMILIAIPTNLIFGILYLFENNTTVLLISSGIATVLSLALGYLSIAIVTIGFRDGFTQALNISRLGNVLFSLEYFVYWIVMLSLSFGFGVLMLLLFVFTFGLGTILVLPLAVLINFITMLLAGRVITQIEATDATPTETATTLAE